MCLLPNWERFLAVISWCAFFRLSFFLISFQVSDDTVLYFPRSLSVCSHFFPIIIFSLLFRLGNFCCSFFQLSNSFLSPFHAVLQFLHWVSSFGFLYFLVLNFHLVLYIFYFTPETFYFFVNALHFLICNFCKFCNVCNCSPKHFYEKFSKMFVRSFLDVPHLSVIIY